MSKLVKERHNGHFRNCVNENNAKKMNSDRLLHIEMRTKKCENVGEEEKLAVGSNGDFLLERERLLSKFSADPTVGSLRDEKESCSTRRGLRVGSEFEEF